MGTSDLRKFNMLRKGEGERPYHTLHVTNRDLMLNIIILKYITRRYATGPDRPINRW